MIPRPTRASACALALWLCLAAPQPSAAVPNITALDCGMRQLAWRWAQQRQPRHGAHLDVFDALRLDALCGLSRDAVLASSPTRVDDDRRGRGAAVRAACAAKRTRCYTVCTAADVDASCEYRSIQTAVAAARAARAPTAPPAVIYLRGGVHYLAETVRLGADDAGLTVTAYPGEAPSVSGGVHIPSDAVTWRPWERDAKVFVADLSTVLGADYRVGNITSLWTAGAADGGHHARVIRARFPNGNPELNQWGYATRDRLKYALDGGVVAEWHKQPENGPRPTYTYHDFAADPPDAPTHKNDSTMAGYNLYASGSGGVCAEIWGADADSYWCSNASAGGWAEVDLAAATAGQINMPRGMDYYTTSPTQGSASLPPWAANASVGGILHAWHSQTWAMHMFEITSNTETLTSKADAGRAIGTLTFAKGGGRQGARNWCRCDQCSYAAAWCGQRQTPPDNTDTRLIGGSWMVENILSELDAPNEFFFDAASRRLYVYPNTTTGAPDGDGYVLSHLARLFEITGTRDVEISGLRLRDAAATYMDDWSPPSGGDWALHRGGAVFMENVDRIAVRGNTFTRCDGTGVFLSRHCENVTVDGNEFAWLGESAVAAWGDTKHHDATAPTLVVGTRMTNNLVREIGIYQKQSSAWFQAKTARTYVAGNIVFNIPRAAVNFNDLTGGGDTVEDNLLFNTCRESGDHGPINSWDRQPYLTTFRDGRTPSFTPLPRKIRRNFIFSNYGGSQGFDTDDGSSWQHITGNVYYASDGVKMDYGGHDSIFAGNIVLNYPYDGQACINFGETFLPGHGHRVYGNICVLGLLGRVMDSGCGDISCAAPAPASDELVRKVATLSCAPGDGVRVHNNAYYVAGAAAYFDCTTLTPANYSLGEFQRRFGQERGSTVAALPGEEQMLAWVREKLGVGKGL